MRYRHLPLVLFNYLKMCKAILSSYGKVQWSHLGPGTICVVRPAGVLFLRVINLFESQNDKETDTNETETQREISWRRGEILYPLVYSPKCLQ